MIRLSVPFALACAALLLGVAPAAAAGPLPPNITSLSFTQNPRTGQDIVFSAVAADDNSGGSISGYAWDFNDDGITDSTQQTPTLTNGFAAGGDHKVTVKVTETEGLTSSSSGLVHVHALNVPPVVDNIVLDVQEPRAGVPVQLFSNASDTDSTGALTYDWDFGDGTAHSSTPNPLHTYAAGNYIATVVVTDSDGAPAMQSVAVPVHGANRPPAIDFAGSFDPNPDAGVAVDMEVDATDDKDTDQLTYSWDFGDGQTSSDASATNTYAAKGFWPVTAAVSDTEGGTTVTGFVQAVGQPTARPSALFGTDYDAFFATNVGTVRTGATMSFYDDSSPETGTTITSRSWHWGDGTADGSGTLPTHAFAAPGHYMVIETVTDSTNNKDEYGEVVTVSDVQLPPHVSIHASPQGPRTGAAVSFSSTVFDPDNPPTQADPDNAHVTYDWDFGDGTAHSAAAAPSHAYATGGSKTVVLTVTDTDDGLSTQAAKVVLVHATNIAPAPLFTWLPRRAGTGQSVVFSNLTTDEDDDVGTLTYTWDFGDGGTSTSDSPSHTYANPGDYFVTLTAHDPNGGTATEGFTVQVLLDALVAPVNQTLPTITGTAAIGETLTATNGTWSGTEPIVFSYEWLRCDSTGAACTAIGFDQQYTLVGADAGHTIRVQVTATNGAGSPSATSQQTAVLTATIVAPANTGAPTVTGTATVGQLLTEHDGTFSGSTSNHTYQWQSCDAAGANCTAVAGATSSTYTLAAADAGHTLRVVDTATNAAGHDSGTSGATDVVAAVVVAPINTGAPTITGTAAVGQLLTEHDGTFTGSPANHTYQWQSCDASGSNCVAVSGASGMTHTVTAADVGHTLRVVDTPTNSAGSASGTSAATAVVPATVSAPSVATAPSISGTATVGSTLAAADGAWTGSPTFNHQWQQCDASGASCADIAGATGPTYTLASADVGHTIRLKVTGTNSAGSVIATTRQTAIVTTAPSGGGGGGGSGLSATQIKAKLAGQIAPKGAAAKIGTLLAKSGYSLAFTAPVAGTVTIKWYYLPAGSHLPASTGATPKPILVATGKRSYSKAGKATITVKLTAAARKLLKKAKSLKIMGKATLTRSGQAKVTATTAFTLKK